jgi:membrane-bound lytic murein transglycosylase F
MVELSPRAYRIQVISGVIAALVVMLLMMVFPSVTRNSMTELEKIQQRGYIEFLTLNSASTYYQDNEGENGFEYHLGLLFSEYIDVEARFVTVSRFADLYTELLFGSGDIVAAGLSKNESEFSNAVVYGPRYYEVTNQILYRRGSVERPKKINDLFGASLRVISGTSQVKLLQQLQRSYADLSWLESDDIASEELIELVEEGKTDFILADSHAIALQRRFFPELRIAFEPGHPKQLRWAFNHADDNSLALAVEAFFAQIRQDGRLEQLIHRHYSYVAAFNYSDIQTFTQHVQNRLPKYEAFFKQEALASGIDWRLLAAIGYQESLWKARAKSPTGVRGLMMLTQATAKQMKVSNRLDPEQSIRGGARYFASVLKRIPEEISEPDRSWLALASYNIGFGHVQDARKLTKINGGDPNKWIDVKKNLPLLARKKWYTGTRYGYARGWEPVKYVENVRLYYDYLVGSTLKDYRDRYINDKRLPVSRRPLAPSH